jgi:hypothetical protein
MATPQAPIGSGFGAASTAAEVIAGRDIPYPAQKIPTLQFCLARKRLPSSVYLRLPQCTRQGISAALPPHAGLRAVA